MGQTQSALSLRFALSDFDFALGISEAKRPGSELHPRPGPPIETCVTMQTVGSGVCHIRIRPGKIPAGMNRLPELFGGPDMPGVRGLQGAVKALCRIWKERVAGKRNVGGELCGNSSPLKGRLV